MRKTGEKERNRRRETLVTTALLVFFLVLITVLGVYWKEDALLNDFSRKNLPPSLRYPFGTDFMGRDMFKRTLTGLSMSIRLGVVTAAASALLAGAAAVLAVNTNRAVDTLFQGCVDVVMGIPHMLLLILISFACGKGFFGIVMGITLTHWPSLARVLRAEALSLKAKPYMRLAGKLGVTKWALIKKHYIPHLLPQFFTGLFLLFPQAVLHEAGMTFLGFGLSPEEPAIGIILSESMKYLVMGQWWLAVFPGAALAATVLMFFGLGQKICLLIDPASVQE